MITSRKLVKSTLINEYMTILHKGAVIVRPNNIKKEKTGQFLDSSFTRET